MPFDYDLSTNVCLATKAYNIEVEQKNAKETIKLLKNTFKNNPYFILHQIRHENRTVYRNAIRTHNAYLADSRVIPIQGVHQDVMFYLDKYLYKIPGVCQVLKHSKTELTG